MGITFWGRGEDKRWSGGGGGGGGMGVVGGVKTVWKPSQRRYQLFLP